MTDRLNIIFSSIPKCKVFADIGCDHGYIAKAMIDCGKCELAIISDISKNCLQKAESLLKDYIQSGIALSFVSDGFTTLPKSDVSLIAGMGGEEIIKIISSAKNNLPKTLVLQPMKNVDKVREFLTTFGYKILKDFCFKAGGKFYDLLIAEVGKDTLSLDELEFGRTNIIENNPVFLERNSLEIKKLNNLLKKDDLSAELKEQFVKRIQRLEKYGKR